MSRIRFSRIFGLTLGAVAGAACSDHSTAPQARMPSAAVQIRVASSSLGWHEQARALVAANNMSPLAAARVFAGLSIAQYRAAKGIDAPNGDVRLVGEAIGAGGRSALEGRRGAVAGASAVVLSGFFPSAATSLEQRVVADGQAGPGNTHPEFTRGLALGRTAGEAMLERVRTDRFTAPWTGSVPLGADKWIANGPPGGATLGGMKTYFLESGSQFRPLPPPAFGSPAFLADLAEIKTIAVNRTPAQTASALYWNFPTGTFTPPGYWNVVTTDYVQSHAFGELAATRTLALVHGAVMDALIGCWDAKYHYWTMRPSQADPSITLTFALPNFPSYPSGHSCASAAAATVLGSLFPERVAEVDAMVREAGLSRMYAGIHYRFDIVVGTDLGAAVGRWAIAHASRIE
jgi:membrane-associated phospholipid phosphatase